MHVGLYALLFTGRVELKLVIPLVWAYVPRTLDARAWMSGVQDRGLLGPTLVTGTGVPSSGVSDCTSACGTQLSSALVLGV